MPSGDPWVDDDPQLIELVAEGWPAAEIAAELGRSHGAVRMRKLKLGLTEPQTPWTEPDEAMLALLVERGEPDKVIAKKLGRSVSSIRAHKSRVGLGDKLAPQPSRRAAIIAGARLYFAARGRRPSTSSGSATAYVGFEVTWPGIDSGLRRGRYGPATSLAELLTEHGIGSPAGPIFADGLGGKIKRARLAAGLTQRELAKRIGYSKHTVRSWENNALRPSEAAMRLLAGELEIDQ